MSTSSRFSKLLEPGKIGQMTIRNRMVMPPMATLYGSKEGYVTQQVIDHYEARAKGGIGLVIVEYICVDFPEGRASTRQMVLDDDKFIPGMSELAEAIKRHGARAALQLQHGGRLSRREVTGLQPVGPSAIPAPGGEMPRELTEAEIARLVNCFARAAVRAKKAGFEGVELHAAHSYFISQFLSAAANQRKDRYGGSVENRARFLVEILKAVKAEVGKEYPVWCRLSAVEVGVENGITLEETKQVARMAEEAGADAIHVSITIGGIPDVLPAAEEPGMIIPLAAAIKEVVSVPVITVRRIDPLLGEVALQKGKVDFIAFGKALLADSEIPNKVAEDRLDDIKPCICCQKCIDSLRPDPGNMRCSVNPVLGREQEYRITAAPKSRKVMVIGGGPAGMEVARVASLRGHKVQLYERGERLGGQLLLAEVAPQKQIIGDLINYLTRQLDKQGTEINLATDVDIDLVVKEAPDVVVLAIGGLPFIPDIPGIEGDNVVQATNILAGKVQAGDSVVVIGGELVGCEVADFLAEAGKKVVLMRRGSELAVELNSSIRGPLLKRLSGKEAITIITGVQYREIRKDGILVVKDGKETFIEADTIVLAAGASPNSNLLPAIKEKINEIYTVGDCVEPRNIMEAMKEGYYVGISL